MGDTDRQFITFYGLCLDDWTETFGTFANTHYFILKEYKNKDVAYTEYSSATLVHNFLFPFDLERIYYLEGTAEGQITVAAQDGESVVTEYKVSIYKTYQGAALPDYEMATTGWRPVNAVLAWDVGYAVGQERVLPFFIHISPEEVVTEHERLFIRVEVHCNEFTVLWHSNDATWEDLFIDIPFKGL